MHVHGFVYVFSDFAGPLMIANGVTGARDMGYYLDTTLRWKSSIAAGREVGPRLVVGARVDGPVSRARFVTHMVTEEDGVRAVDTLSRKKMDPFAPISLASIPGSRAPPTSEWRGNRKSSASRSRATLRIR